MGRAQTLLPHPPSLQDPGFITPPLPPFLPPGPWPTAANSTVCGDRLQCMVAVRNGQVRLGSVSQVNLSSPAYAESEAKSTSGAMVFQMIVDRAAPDSELAAMASAPGLIEIMLLADMCNPSSEPAVAQVQVRERQAGSSVGVRRVRGGGYCMSFCSSLSLLEQYLYQICTWSQPMVSVTYAF
jgi:hypothetical protein